MLAYYTTLVKKESLLDRLKLDADEIYTPYFFNSLNNS